MDAWFRFASFIQSKPKDELPPAPPAPPGLAAEAVAPPPPPCPLFASASFTHDMPKRNRYCGVAHSYERQLPLGLFGFLDPVVIKCTRYLDSRINRTSLVWIK